MAALVGTRRAVPRLFKEVDGRLRLARTIRAGLVDAERIRSGPEIPILIPPGVMEIVCATAEAERTTPTLVVRALVETWLERQRAHAGLRKAERAIMRARLAPPFDGYVPERVRLPLSRNNVEELHRFVGRFRGTTIQDLVRFLLFDWLEPAMESGRGDANVRGRVERDRWAAYYWLEEHAKEKRRDSRKRSRGRGATAGRSGPV